MNIYLNVLQAFIFDFICLETIDFRRLKESLLDLNIIVGLDFTGTKFESEMIRMLSDLAEQLSSLKKLFLRQCNIDNGRLDQICNSNIFASTVNVLDLGANCFGDEGVDMLINMLINMRMDFINLKRLVIKNKNISKSSHIEFRKSMHDCKIIPGRE